MSDIVLPLISVVVPIYNVEKYLNRCVDSIICQTYKNLEILLVNDGSPDNSLQICREYENVDKRVKVIDKMNGGLGSARNAGIDIMSGEYVLFIDSDDYIDSEMISRLYTILQQNSADISVCKFCKVYDDHRDEQNSEPNIRLWNGKEALYQMFFPNGIGWAACAKMYRSSLFENVRYAEKVYWEDMATTYLLYEKAECIAETTEELYYYYIRSDSITGNKSAKRAVDAISNIEVIIRYYQENHPELVNAPKAFYAKIAPNFLVTLNNEEKESEIQQKCADAIVAYGKLAIKAKFIKKKYKIVIGGFYLVLKVSRTHAIQKKWFHRVCGKIAKYVK